jgi:phage terminase large subunit-like protein
MSELAKVYRRAPIWSTACLDWEERIVQGRSLIPFDPLFPEQAAAALEIFRDLRIKDAIGSPTMGEACRQWVFDFVGAIFGAYDAETGRRLINNFLLLVSKKNSKSTIAAGIMLTALVRNWRESGEFYILAPTLEIANNSFFPARDMIALDDNLRTILHVQQNTRTITHRNTDAFLKVVAADSETVGGKKTIGLLKDELWLFGKRSGAENMFREAAGGLASRPEGFEIALTTQSETPPAGVFDQALKEFRDIRDGKIIVPESLGVLYEFPKAMVKDKAFENPKNFYITNPNLNASVDEPFLLRKLAEAQRAGQHSVIGFLAKHLNVEITGSLRSDGWAGARIWNRGVDEALRSLGEFLKRCEIVGIGLDGGGLDDLLGIGLVGREKGTKRWLAWSCGLISTIGLVRRKANLEEYRAFVAAGELIIFRLADEDATEIESDPDVAAFLQEFPPGQQTGALPFYIQYIVDLVTRVRDLGILAQVGVDAAGIGSIVDALAEIGITQDAEKLDAVRQGIGLMGAYKTIELKLADKTFLHGGQLLLTWCVGNVKVVLTSTASRIAREESGYGKIDPFVALCNAAHLMSLNPGSSEARGIFEYYRDGIITTTSRQPAKDAIVALRAPRGTSTVHSMSGAQYVVDDDGMVKVTEADSKSLISHGFEPAESTASS